MHNSTLRILSRNFRVRYAAPYNFFCPVLAPKNFRGPGVFFFPSFMAACEFKATTFRCVARRAEHESQSPRPHRGLEPRKSPKRVQMESPRPPAPQPLRVRKDMVPKESEKSGKSLIGLFWGSFRIVVCGPWGWRPSRRLSTFSLPGRLCGGREDCKP